LIFPEGQTSQDGLMTPFRSGIGLLAQQLRLPVVPIRLDGLFELKRDERKVAKPGQVKVTIGQPVRFSPDQDPKEIARELERRVAEL
jgi:1-acyl-sn-glycerol-3-phosphate acyltransferase